ncbi:MAG TPA: LCP family protein [Streptosporangiaceae bacterium]|jgi:LCP family protein required for cell wall assembly
MSEWPEGWFRDGQNAGGTAGGLPGSSARDNRAGPVFSDLPTVAGEAPGSSRRAAAGFGPPADSAWPEQPPSHGSPASRHGGGLGGPAGYGGRRGWRPRRILAIIAVIVALLLVAVVGLYFYFNGKLDRKNVLVGYAGRPAPADGQNWLITGSDSRQGLTGREERVLATGHDISGHRSDTILVLHIGAGRPVLVSIPRDSYVEIPGHGLNKINAAYAFGGPKLLAKTVQNATGLYINHFMGIGFGGLVSVVNAIGGVHMCIPGPMTDPKAGLHLKAGCQTLNGDQALGFVRTRNFSESDLQREQDQRQFIKALLNKMTSTGTILNPFASIPAASGAAGALTVDQGASLYNLISVAFALRNPLTTTVPIANANLQTSAGDAVQWNTADAKILFNALRDGTKVPKRLISGSKLTGTV